MAPFVTPLVTIALVRHGEYAQPEGVPSAGLPGPLTERGHTQAIQAATDLRNIARFLELDINPTIDCSISLRSWQTAALISASLFPEEQAAPVQYESLCERSLGAMSNLTIAQIESHLADDPRYSVPDFRWKSDPFYQLPFPGAESLMQAGQRVADHLTTYQTQDSASLKIIVGHGAALRHAAVHLGMLALHEVGAVTMLHASPVIIQYDGGAWHHVPIRRSEMSNTTRTGTLVSSPREEDDLFSWYPRQTS
ncbi:MAG: histidine phosphatase family protein [Pseudomonadota bacterium]